MRFRVAAIAMFAAYGLETLCLLVANGKFLAVAACVSTAQDAINHPAEPGLEARFHRFI
jgi:hypothetical protein